MNNMRPNDLNSLISAMIDGDWIGIPHIDPVWLAGHLRKVTDIILSPLNAIACGRSEPVATAVAKGGFYPNKTNSSIIEELRRHPIGSQIFVPTRIRADGITYRDDYVIAVPDYYFGSHAVLAIRA
jgi:hypothetical protein